MLVADTGMLATSGEPLFLMYDVWHTIFSINPTTRCGMQCFVYPLRMKVYCTKPHIYKNQQL